MSKTYVNQKALPLSFTDIAIDLGYILPHIG